MESALFIFDGMKPPVVIFRVLGITFFPERFHSRGFIRYHQSFVGLTGCLFQGFYFSFLFWIGSWFTAQIQTHTLAGLEVAMRALPFSFLPWLKFPCSFYFNTFFALF